MSKGVLVDVARCIGCKGCMVSCKSWNDLPANKGAFSNNWDSPGKTSADTWTSVLNYVIDEGNELKWRFVKRQCMHCNKPACESACFTHSFVKTSEGAVVYKPTEINKDYCVGCRYCMIACPFGTQGFQWDKPFPYVLKCRFCYERIKEKGMEPACVTCCPSGCLKFGERSELISEAWDRIHRDPKYVKHVYGEEEYGGTSWLYISDVPFDRIGFKTEAFGKPVSRRAIPSLTWEVLKWTPAIFLGWGTFLAIMRMLTKKQVHGQDESEDYAPVDSGE